MQALGYCGENVPGRFPSSLSLDRFHFIWESSPSSIYVLSPSSPVQLYGTPWTVAHQASLAMEFSGQEYRSRLSSPPPGNLPDPEIQPTSLASPALEGVFLTTSTTWEAHSSISSFQSHSQDRLFATPWTTAHQASLSITNCRSLPKPMSIEWCHPTISSSRPLLLQPSTFSSIRVFSNESALQIRWPKYWSFSFNISPSNEDPGLISLRMDWWDLLAVQGTLKSLLQHHSSKASILWCSAFFIVQLHIHTWPLEKP